MANVDQPRPSRRERRRQQTLDEIVEVSRNLLREGSELSLRAISAEVGMTTPGLYNYVDSVDDLHALVARSIYVDVVAVMAEASRRFADDPAAELAASATAFREWSWRNKPEFRLVFAGPLSGSKANRAPIMGTVTTGDDREGAGIFADHFAQIFVRLAVSGLMRIPDLSEMDESIRDLIENRTRLPEREMLDHLGPDGAGAFWLFQVAWARLYGVVMLEAFELIDAALVTSGALFNVLMRENFTSLGLADSWERLAAVSRQVSAAGAV